MAEKETEIQRVRQKLRKTEKVEADLRRQVKVKDAIINQSLSDVKDIVKMLCDLETASKLDTKTKDDELRDLTLQLKLKDQLLQDLERDLPKKATETKNLELLESKLAETTLQLQNLQSKFDVISSVVDEFKLEQTFQCFTKPSTDANLSINDLL